MGKHIFALILNNRSYTTYYKHGLEDLLRIELLPEERIIKTWEIIEERSSHDDGHCAKDEGTGGSDGVSDGY